MTLFTHPIIFYIRYTIYYIGIDAVILRKMISTAFNKYDFTQMDTRIRMYIELTHYLYIKLN